MELRSRFPTILSDIQVLDFARQDDGKAIGVGRSLVGGLSKLAVFRLDEDGALDSPSVATRASCGSVRKMRLTPGAALHSIRTPAASWSSELATTTPCSSCGCSTTAAWTRTSAARGLHPATPPFQGAASVRPRIVRTADGNYRVSVSPVDETCTVAGVTADGLLDEAFGSDGLAVVDLRLTCGSMVAQPEGELVLAGEGDDARVIAIRLLASGDPDPDLRHGRGRNHPDRAGDRAWRRSSGFRCSCRPGRRCQCGGHRSAAGER